MQTQTSSLGDLNTPSPHNKGAPTLSAITEASTFSVHAVQRYDSYGGQNYLKNEMKMRYGQRHFLIKHKTCSLIVVFDEIFYVLIS